MSKSVIDIVIPILLRKDIGTKTVLVIGEIIANDAKCNIKFYELKEDPSSSDKKCIDFLEKSEEILYNLEIAYREFCSRKDLGVFNNSLIKIRDQLKDVLAKISYLA